MSLTSVNGTAVSKICLGTMTWGQQNSEADAHAQIDFALDHGVNFMDAAEMYPVPPKEETQGRTEEFIGTWFARTGQRDRWILATKAAGPSVEFKYLRGGPRFTREQLIDAVDNSLKRLQTDYIDLYQLHWPDRSTNCFGRRGFVHTPDEQSTPIEETLRGLQDLVASGKIRGIGLSNETPWGVMRFLQLAEREGLPRVQTVQNPYNLLNRQYETGLAEVSQREDVGLLAYSPLAMGLLSGKYRNGALPPNSRMALFKRFSRYEGNPAAEATERYCALADAHGLSPTHMALAFVNSRSFVLSNIIGATTLEQLAENIDSTRLTLSQEVLNDIEAIHSVIPDPCP